MLKVRFLANLYYCKYFYSNSFTMCSVMSSDGMQEAVSFEEIRVMSPLTSIGFYQSAK